jgi:hypothetical protein
LSLSIRPIFVAALFVVIQASSALAQSILDRVVDDEANHRRLVVNELTGQAVGRLAAAAGVPMGIEMVPGNPGHPKSPIVASGRHLREVLDAIVAADPRYEWRDDNGVIVFRSGGSWAAPSDILDIQIGPMTLDRVDSGDAMGVLKHVLGAQPGSASGPGDTKRFSVDLPGQSSLLLTLDAIVRAHGTLAWSVEFTKVASGRSVDFPATLELFTGATGSGFGIPRNAAIQSGPFTVGHRHAESAQVPVLERIVGPTLDGRPLKINGIGSWGVSRLAAAVGVPMGVQTPARGPAPVRPGFEGITVTGMPLKVALEAIGSLDPRFEWRDMDGVIVFRPVEAWADPYDPLFRIIPSSRLDDVPLAKAAGLVASALGAPEHTNDSNDSRHFSIDLPQATVIDLLNAVVRSHGELTWGWSAEQPTHPRPTGYRHMITFWSFHGWGSFGFDVP